MAPVRLAFKDGGHFASGARDLPQDLPPMRSDGPRSCAGDEASGLWRTSFSVGRLEGKNAPRRQVSVCRLVFRFAVTRPLTSVYFRGSLAHPRAFRLVFEVCSHATLGLSVLRLAFLGLSVFPGAFSASSRRQVGF